MVAAPHIAADTVTSVERIMVTGHRQLGCGELVERRMDQILDRYPDATAISGGAEGADRRWAERAHARRQRYELWLPNRHYRSRYPHAVTDSICGGAADITYVVDRPDISDWRKLWDTERWWVDNFTRNVAMIDTSTIQVVVSGHHPLDLARHERGGTAHTVKQLARRDAVVLWLPDRDDRDLCWVRLRASQPDDQQLSLL